MLEVIPGRGPSEIPPVSFHPPACIIPISNKGQNAKPKGRERPGAGNGGGKNAEHFAGANKNAKLVRSVANFVRRARLEYEGFRRLCADVRKELGMQRPPRSRRLPRVLPETSLKKFFDTIRQGGDLQHEIMLKLLSIPPSGFRNWSIMTLAGWPCLSPPSTSPARAVSTRRTLTRCRPTTPFAKPGTDGNRNTSPARCS
jgi:hypothetical protein